MERQIANLTGLVQKALTHAPVVAPTFRNGKYSKTKQNKNSTIIYNNIINKCTYENRNYYYNTNVLRKVIIFFRQYRIFTLYFYHFFLFFYIYLWSFSRIWSTRALKIPNISILDIISYCIYTYIHIRTHTHTLSHPQTYPYHLFFTYYIQWRILIFSKGGGECPILIYIFKWRCLTLIAPTHRIV